MIFNTMLANLKVRKVNVYILSFVLCGGLLYSLINLTDYFGMTPILQLNQLTSQGKSHHESYHNEIKKYQEYSLMRLHLL